MTLLRTTCPQCGPTEVALRRATLRIDTDDRSGTCAVRCDCGMRINKALEPAMIVMLLAAGIDVEMWGHPTQGAAIATAEPISHDELERFRTQLLDDHEVLRQVAILTPCPPDAEPRA